MEISDRKVGSSVRRSVCIGDGNMESSPLEEKLFVSECIYEVSSFVGSSDVQVGSSVGTSVGIGHFKMEGYPLVENFICFIM